MSAHVSKKIRSGSAPASTTLHRMISSKRDVCTWITGSVGPLCYATCPPLARISRPKPSLTKYIWWDNFNAANGSCNPKSRARLLMLRGQIRRGLQRWRASPVSGGPGEEIIAELRAGWRAAGVEEAINQAEGVRTCLSTLVSFKHHEFMAQHYSLAVCPLLLEMHKT